MFQDDIIVRHGLLSDYPRARRVIAETFTFHRKGAPQFFRDTDAPPPTRQFIEDLMDGEATFLLAEHDGSVVGFCTVAILQAPDTSFFIPARRAVVDNVGVLPEYRRQGVGRKLMAAAEEWARRKRADRMELSIWEFNAGAIHHVREAGIHDLQPEVRRRLMRNPPRRESKVSLAIGPGMA